VIDPVAKIEKVLKQLAQQRAGLRAQVAKQPNVADELRQALSQLDQTEAKLQALKPRAAKLKKRQAARARKPVRSARAPMSLPAGWPLSAEQIQAAAQALVQRVRPATLARPATAAPSQGSDVHTMDSAAWKVMPGEDEHKSSIIQPVKPPPPKPQRRISDSSLTGWEIVDDPDS
jgi:hypothetical protein